MYTTHSSLTRISDKQPHEMTKDPARRPHCPSLLKDNREGPSQDPPNKPREGRL